MPAIRHIYNGSSPLLRAAPCSDDKLVRVDAISGQPRAAHWQGFLALADPKPRPGRLVSILAKFATSGDGGPGPGSEWRTLRDDERILGWVVQLRAKVYGVYGLCGPDGWPIVIGGLNADPYYKPVGDVLFFPGRNR